MNVNYSKGGILLVRRMRLIVVLAKVLWRLEEKNLQGGSVAEWSSRRTRNPAVLGSTPAMATCWLCSRSSRI